MRMWNYQEGENRIVLCGYIGAMGLWRWAGRAWNQGTETAAAVCSSAPRLTPPHAPSCQHREDFVLPVDLEGLLTSMTVDAYQTDPLTATKSMSKGLSQRLPITFTLCKVTPFRFILGILVVRVTDSRIAMSSGYCEQVTTAVLRLLSTCIPKTEKVARRLYFLIFIRKHQIPYRCI